MRRCGGRLLVSQALCALVFASGAARANPGDAENAQDYPGFPRQAGFVISDYAEDNPAEADFPIARPLPLDASHVETAHVRGHRFVIRYELNAGNPPSVYQTQLYYEKLAASGGFQVAKGGAVGDVTETFCRSVASRDIWVFLEPSNNVNVLTIIEAPRGSTPIAPPPALVIVAPPPTLAPVAVKPTATPALVPLTNTVTPVPATPPAPPPNPEVADAAGDALYTSLIQETRIVVPFTFQPGKEELDASSQPEIDRIAAMLKKHPDLVLRIEGHTDNTGDPEDNLRLSAQRAIAVETKLVAADIDKKRLDAVGVGGLQPRADNNTAEGREKNRRIELVVWKKYSHPPTGGGA
jgi:outer membrane protein OmpA-like peptidoglycan-associated protein